jgi:hypothetical protein
MVSASALIDRYLEADHRELPKTPRTPSSGPAVFAPPTSLVAEAGEWPRPVRRPLSLAFSARGVAGVRPVPARACR